MKYVTFYLIRHGADRRVKATVGNQLIVNLFKFDLKLLFYK